MGSDVYGLPSRETYPDSQNLRSDGAKIRSIFESSKYFGTFFIARRFFLQSSSLFPILFVPLQSIMVRTKDDYYIESKRIRNEVLTMAEALKGEPLRFTITNGITMDVEITKSDLKTIVSKASRDNKFNAIKNALAKDIPSYLKKGQYLGWRRVVEGKHEESAYFAYFDREIGVKTILAMRKMKNGGPYKPYAIIDQYAFENNVGELEKGTPL